MKPAILILGAGGHARVVAATLNQAGWQLAGVLDVTRNSLGELIHVTKVVGSYDELPEWYARGIRHAFPAVGDNRDRRAMVDRLQAAGFEVPSVVHPRAILEPGARIGVATLVCSAAILGVDVRVDEACIINTGTIVEHESTVAADVHIAPGCRIAGRVTIGRGAFVGIGSVVKEKISIGADAIVGAGSVVVSDIPAAVVAYGVPARVIPAKARQSMPGREAERAS